MSFGPESFRSHNVTAHLMVASGMWLVNKVLRSSFFIEVSNVLDFANMEWGGGLASSLKCLLNHSAVVGAAVLVMIMV